MIDFSPFNFNLGELLALPILIFFILLISQVNFKIPFLTSLPTVLLDSFEFGDVQKGGFIVKITGLETGFTAWLLDKLRIRSRFFSFIIDENQIIQGKPGRCYSVNNLTDLYSVKIGYSLKVTYLIISVAAVFAVISGYLSSDYHGDDEYVAMFIGLLISGLFFWLYRRSGALFLKVEHRSIKTVIGLRIKSGLTGKEIKLEDLKALEIKIMNAARLNSRWFNTYYTR